MMMFMLGALFIVGILAYWYVAFHAGEQHALEQIEDFGGGEDPGDE